MRRIGYTRELLSELSEPCVDGWVHWYFTFNDNASLSKQDIKEKIDAVPVGTKMYKNKILGLRGRALRGIVEDLMSNAMFTLPTSGESEFNVTIDYAKEKLEEAA